VIALVDLLIRAADLVALAALPVAVSPAPDDGGWVMAVVAALALGLVVVASARAGRRSGGLDARIGALCIALSLVAAVACAVVFRGDRAPIGRGVLFVAAPLWCGLALVAASVARRALVGRVRFAWLVGAAPVVIAAALMFALSSSWLFSVDRMWLTALARGGDNEAAADALVALPLRTRRYDAAAAALDGCLEKNPGACACLARRAELGLRLNKAAHAITDAVAARDKCPTSPTARAVYVEALAMHGDAELAEQEARAAIAAGDGFRVRYALALALDRGGRHAEALAEAKRAVDLGAGRDAGMLVGSLAIGLNDLDSAVAALSTIVKADPTDGDAQYDLALVADRKNDYNGARQGYLAALRANPKLAEARYNLALLTLRQGALPEARHHVERFLATFPGDPRGPALAARVSAAAPPPAPQ
jgi:tetratricopeptide (TPR) repeat protein